MFGIARVLIVFSLSWAVPAAWACQTFMVPESGAKVMGKNYVWHQGHGRLYLNRAGMSRKALLRDERMNAASWRTKYASLTFNQIAENFPNGGINSAGVGVEILLGQAEYPTSTSKDAINELQWIQYILDTSKDVDEAIEQAGKVDIVPIGNHRVHYHVCDKRGQCAVFEYLDEALVVSREEEDCANPIAVTNATYASNGIEATPAGAAVEDPMLDAEDLPLLPRPVFSKAYDRSVQSKLDSFGAKAKGTRSDEVFGMYRILQSMSASPQWQIVYELANGWVHFRAGRSFGIRSVDLAGFTVASDKDCRKGIWLDSRTRKRYVLPPLRYDLDTVPDAGYGVKAVVVNRSDFSYKDSRMSVLSESRSFLRSAGVDESIYRKVEKYPATHTACVMD